MSLSIILGSMFSGKTSELLRRIGTVTEIGMQGLYINHSIDTRNQQDIYSTHNPHLKDKLSNNIVMISTDDLSKVDDALIRQADIIGVDEVQFFNSLDPIIKWVDIYKKHVIVVGLDGDYKRKKFGNVLDLIPLCDSVTKLTANCIKCAKSKKITPAIFTHRIESSGNIIDMHGTNIDIGAHEKYISLCRECYLLC